MVPRLLSPTYNCTSVQQRFDEPKIKRHLIEPLNSFIAGTDHHRDLYQVSVLLPVSSGSVSPIVSSDKSDF